jgi:alanyl-tRNA synthetase
MLETVTERLYYHDSFLLEFDATVAEVRECGGRTGLVLDRTAFYPEGGGQPSDTGSLISCAGGTFRVLEVADAEDGAILHFIESDHSPLRVESGQRVHGAVDAGRRRDHMQQHSGQHVLSAAFIKLFRVPTVSFHMGDESCTIDLETAMLSGEQLAQAEDLANAVVMEDRKVEVGFASPEEARARGTRKFTLGDREQLRLVSIPDFDVNACGGTHAERTGQIGMILLRKSEKVKQGIRVEFVCGERALRAARQDYATLTEAAGLYSTHIRELPAQARKSLDEIKALQRDNKKLREEVAELRAAKLLAEAPLQGKTKLVSAVFADQDTGFIKLMAQKITALAAASGNTVVVLFGGLGGPQPALVFAQTPGGPHDMGTLMKETTAQLGGRGGGNKDVAQGGAPAGTDLERAISQVSAVIGQWINA